MTATASQQTKFGATELPPVETPAGRVRTRRQPRWIAAGLLAIALGGLGAALLWQQLVTTNQVIVVQRPISRGEVIRSGDLRVADIGSTTGISTVDAAEISALVGKSALVDLAEGSLLPRGSLGTPTLDRGSSQVGLKLAPGRLPTGELPVGSQVRLVPLEDPRRGPGPPQSGPPPVLVTATIASPPRTGPDGVAILVDVKVEQSLAQQVAELSAGERLALVKEAGR